MRLIKNRLSLKRYLSVFVLAVTLFCSYFVFASYPQFDYDKYHALSIEKRNAYDVVFFNELETWNMNSTRYPIERYGQERKAEFQKMAADGYLPAYAALRLIQIVPATERYDREAFDMLVKAAEQGDASAMCAIDNMPLEAKLHEHRMHTTNKLFLTKKSAELGNGACMAYYGRILLLGNVSEIPKDPKKALPLLIESARQGYYVAHKAFFYEPLHQVLNEQIDTLSGRLDEASHRFDFSDEKALKKAMCWGRLSEQHTSWAYFDSFIEGLNDYAKANNRADLLEMSRAYDPKFVPNTIKIVNPEDCIKLELGE
jgi:hypothetical protein